MSRLFLRPAEFSCHGPRQITANPRIEICASDGGEWLRIAATLVEDGRTEAQQAMLDD